MLTDRRLFDEWAAKYDKDIKQSGHGYPFDGYQEIIAFVQSKVDLARKGHGVIKGHGVKSLHSTS